MLTYCWIVVFLPIEYSILYLKLKKEINRDLLKALNGVFVFIKYVHNTTYINLIT